MLPKRASWALVRVFGCFFNKTGGYWQKEAQRREIGCLSPRAPIVLYIWGPRYLEKLGNLGCPTSTFVGNADNWPSSVFLLWFDAVSVHLALSLSLSLYYMRIVLIS